jgi:hypothetical protein
MKRRTGQNLSRWREPPPGDPGVRQERVKLQDAVEELFYVSVVNSRSQHGMFLYSAT